MFDDEENKLEEEKTGPMEWRNEGWKTVAVPVEQYNGVREQTHRIPWLCVKHSVDGLKNDEEKKTLVTDIQILNGKNPFVRPNYGFDKIEVDLR